MDDAPTPMRERLRMDFRWTPRQREVLELIAGGKSNAEIAELLGVSIVGAKWHVGEILSKLQAESREEAAEYWRRHNGLAPRFARVFRGILGAAALKWLGAGAAVAVAGASAVLFILVREDDAPPPGPPPVAIAPSAEDRDHDFALLLEADQAKWAAGEPITVRATLSYIGGGVGTTYYSSGQGPIAFGVREVGGTRGMDAMFRLDCGRSDIAAGVPLMVPYRKSGAYEPGEPNAPFYEEFFADPLFRLPTGTWDVTAQVNLVLPPGCGEGATQVQSQATIRLVVD